MAPPTQISKMKNVTQTLTQSDTSDTHKPTNENRRRGYVLTWWRKSYGLDKTKITPETYKDDVKTLQDLLMKADVKKFIFSLEFSNGNVDGDGGAHFQGTFDTKNARYLAAVIKYMDKAKVDKMWYIRPAMKAAEDRYDYAQKDETHVAGPWRLNCAVPEKLELIETLLPWQQEIADLIDSKPDRRTIHWFWDEAGNIGKTVFSKYICATRDVLFVGGSAKECMTGVADWVNPEKNGGEPRKLQAVIYGLPRDTDPKYVSYKALETIKDGLFYTTRYRSRMTLYNCPHVIVFANCPPTESKMTPDKWCIVDLGLKPDIQAFDVRVGIKRTRLGTQIIDA